MESNTDTNSNPTNTNSDPNLYMYILVNDDLKMGKGKIASQVGHVVGLITEKIIREGYESIGNTTPDCYTRYIQWKNTGHAKIILKASEADIEALMSESKSESMYIIDAGRTQIKPNSLTVLGFYPSNANKEKFLKFKLL